MAVLALSSSLALQQLRSSVCAHHRGCLEQPSPQTDAASVVSAGHWAKTSTMSGSLYPGGCSPGIIDRQVQICHQARVVTFTPVGLTSILNLWWLVAILPDKQWLLGRRPGDSIFGSLKKDSVSKDKGCPRNDH